MKRIDLHDDVLLDCARRGTLSPAQEQRLLAHCRSCAACALELGWIEDGLHAAAPNAEDHARGRAAVDAVLGLGVGASEWPRTQSAPAPVARGRAGGAGMRFSSAAALALLGLCMSSAAAAFFTGALPALPQISTWLQPAEQAPAQAAKVRKHARVQHATHPQLCESDSLVPSAQAAASEQGAVTAAPAAPATPVVDALVVAPVRPPSAAAPQTTAVRAELGSAARERAAEALLSTANQARSVGDYSVALARYTELSLRYPGTRAEVLSRVSRGNLWLGSLSEPARAQGAFASYLAARPGGVLAEEARVGLARSLAQLGRRDQERAAWIELIERHPSSLHLAYARARLATLAR